MLWGDRPLAVFDNAQHSYQEWRAEVMKVVQIIDQDEDLPYGG